jgi:putative ABC transport system permease protein
MTFLPTDLRHACRAAFRDRRSAVGVLLMLSLGLGASSAIFQLIDAVLLRPLPFPDSRALVLARQTVPKTDAPFAVTAHDYLAWRERSRTLVALGAIRGARVNLGDAKTPSWVVGARVSADFFRALATPPLAGRTFAPEEHSAADARVAVISEGLWRRHLGGASLAAQRLPVNGVPHAIVGVMPASVRFPPQCEIWLPLALDPAGEEPGNHTLVVLGRLAPGRTVEQARAELGAIAVERAQRYPETNAGWGITIGRLDDLLTREPRPALLMLFGAALAALLIACANAGMLLLARAAGRRQEVAVRVALGAGRARLFGQFVLEAELLAVAGGAGALLVALWLSVVLLGSIPPALLVKGDLRVDGGTLAFVAVLALGAGFVLGVPAAFAAVRVNSAAAMRGAAGTTSASDGRIGRWLVVAQLSLAVTLLVGAGLMIRTFVRLAHVDPGFDPRDVTIVEVAPAGAIELSEAARRGAYEDLLARVSAIDGVSAAGAIGELPLAGASNAHAIVIDGSPGRVQAAMRVVTAGYFRAMGIPITRGRLFAPEEMTDAPGPGVVLVNEAMARRFWPGQDAVGRRLALFADERTPRPWLTIVGVAGNVRHRGLAAEFEPEFYMPHAQLPAPAMVVVARGGRPAAIGPALRQAVAEAAPAFAVRDLRRLEAVVVASVTPHRTRAALAGILAVLAATLAFVGLYGLTAWTVARRRHEFGVRLALGADRRQLSSAVLGWTFRIVAVGTALGVAGAIVVWGLLARWLTAVGPVDPVVIAAVALLMAVVVVAAGYAPARRAGRVDPVLTLRHE